MLTGESMESTGSAMIGDTDYNSACYYIYASIDSDTLQDNLRFGENPDLLVQKAIPALLQTMAWSNPTGKQNSFAGHVLPSAVLVECKEKKVPVSYVNAFVEPAYATQKRDLVAASAEKLVQECDMIARNFGVPVFQAPVVLRGQVCDHAAAAGHFLRYIWCAGGRSGQYPGMRWHKWQN